MRRCLKNIVICFFIVLFSFGLAACAAKEIFEYSKANISEIRTNLFIGKTENAIVTFTSGYREEEYLIDGKSTENVPFGVITAIILNDNKFNITKNFVATINGNNYQGEFEINPYDNSLVYDIQESIEDWAIISISIILDELYETINLENISSSWNMTSLDALEIACENFKSELKKYVKENMFNMEVYIKILFDFENLDNPYFWLVSFVGTDNKDISIVLDINSGEILSKKIV